MRLIIEKLEWFFRHSIVYPFLRSVLRNRPFDGYVDLSSLQSILILRYDKIGDMIVTKPIFRILKKRNPRLKVGVVTSPANAEILANDPNVDRKHVLDSNPVRLCSMLRDARREKYEVVLNLIFNRTTTGALISNTISPRGIKVGQGEEKYRFYFNKLVCLPRSELHMVEELAYYISQVFGTKILPEELDLFYEIDAQAEGHVDGFLKENNLSRRKVVRDSTRFVVFNISAGEPSNRFSLDQIIDVAKHLSKMKETNTVLIFAPTDGDVAHRVERAVASRHCLRFTKSGRAPLSEIASLVQGAYCVITPDTSIVHFASALRTPTLAIFSPLLKSKEWFPFRVPYHTVTAEPRMPVSSIPSSRLIEGIETFLAELETPHAVEIQHE